MLTPDNVRYENGVKINEKIIPDTAKATKYVSSWVPKGGKMKPGGTMKPIGVTIHNTPDLDNVYDDAEQYTRATYPNCNMKGSVVHYYVDDTCAWQNLRETEPGWHASDGSGDGNARTIAIEVIMTNKNQEADKKARDNAARLTAYLLNKYNWSVDDVYTHNHWMGLPDRIVSGAKKNCPLYLLPEWSAFKNLVKEYTDISESSGGEKSSSLEYIQVGDILRFKGTQQYISSTSESPKKATSNLRVRVTAVASSEVSHPIHVRSVDDLGNYISGIYGWVNSKDLSSLEFNPYLVQVTADKLNVRSGPNTSYRIVSVIEDKGSYTIVEESNGWGKLKSKLGWINLSYTKKI